ncbi:MAG: M3 family metallopeptidase [Candidatus Heimdallarchaeota archaeon]
MNTQPRSLNSLAADFEKYAIQMGEQRYNQTAGLQYDENLMKSIAEIQVELGSEFLASYMDPRSLYLSAISTTVAAKKLPLTIKIHELRPTLIRNTEFEVNGTPVNWGSWRQFNSQSDKASDRKEVFDDFIAKAPQLAPLVEQRFHISREIYSKYDISPLDSYLEREGFEYQKLHDLMVFLGEEARKPFLAASEHYAPEILGKSQFEYFDDYYVARGRIYAPLNKHFQRKDPIKAVEKVLSNWGFQDDLKRISVDSDDREKKSPSAFCFSIRVPDDVRVVYKRVSPFSDFTSVFHEFGHAVHGVSGRKEDPFWIRYLVPMSVAETFSIFLESLLEQPQFLKTELGMSDEVVDQIIDRQHFMNLYFLVFYAANSLMKLEFWKKEYTVEVASDRYQKLTKQFFWEIPGNYWLLHHVMPDYDVYSPSYILASIRVKEWIDQMVDEFGEEFWKDGQAGTVFRDLAATRGEFDLAVWDMDPKPYLEGQTQFSFFSD